MISKRGLEDPDDLELYFCTSQFHPDVSPAGASELLFPPQTHQHTPPTKDLPIPDVEG